MSPIPNPTLGLRLASRLERKPNGCLEWTGYVDPDGGNPRQGGALRRLRLSEIKM